LSFGTVEPVLTATLKAALSASYARDVVRGARIILGIKRRDELKPTFEEAIVEQGNGLFICLPGL